MCIKNHVALRDYAKHLLKYMENPVYSQNILNMKMNRAETESNESDLHDREKIPDSEHDSDYSEDEQDNRNVKTESPHEDLNNSLDEPLALVKSDRKNKVESNENSINYPLYPTTIETPPKKVKNEDYSDDDSVYQCEDLSKKPKLDINEQADNSKLLSHQTVPPNGLPTSLNPQNDMVMKYLKLEYSDREDNNHTNGKSFL